MAKQTVIALSAEGVWLCGKIGRHPFALKYSDVDLHPMVPSEKYYFPEPAYKKGIEGNALIRHSIGNLALSQKEKRLLNALLSFSVQVPEPSEMFMISHVPYMYITEVDDMVDGWTLNYAEIRR